MNPEGLIPTPGERAESEKAEADRTKQEQDKLLLDLQRRQTTAQVTQTWLTFALILTSIISGFVSWLNFKAAKDTANAALASSMAAIAQIKVSQDANRISETNARLSFKESKSSREASEKQSRDALNASIRAFRNDQRAWIGVVDIATPQHLEVGTDLRPIVGLINSGKTPALDVFQLAAYRIIPKGENIDPAKERNFGATFLGVIVPNGRRDLTINDLGHIGAVRARELNTGEYRLYIFGRIVYRDIFGYPHETHFCVRLELGEHMAFSPYGKYNEAN